MTAKYDFPMKLTYVLCIISIFLVVFLLLFPMVGFRLLRFAYGKICQYVISKHDNSKNTDVDI